MSKSPNPDKNLLAKKIEKKPVLAYNNGDLSWEVFLLKLSKKELLDVLCDLQPSTVDFQYALAMVARSKDKTALKVRNSLEF